MSLTIDSGFPPYTYTWSNGDTVASISSLSGGQYIVTVTDTSHCGAIDTIVITAPSSALSIAINFSDIACYGAETGTASAAANGGTPFYLYRWSNGGVTPGITGLPAGTYTVTVTDHNLCTTTNSVTVTQPQVPISVTSNTTQTIQGQSTGTASLTATGGVSSFSESWSNGDVGDTITDLAADVIAIR